MTEFFRVAQVDQGQFPPLLLEIPQIPERLYVRGVLPSASMRLLSVVGSRRYTTYGKQVVQHLIAGLQSYNIGIVSGLALGIDSLAHEAALQNEIYTLAIPGSGLSDEVIYPAAHKPLARKILESGGGLLSEYEPNFKATKWSFIQRNRLMAGIAHATLVIEASERSGTLSTARMATDYNRELLVVPGDIFSRNSAGVHQFLKLGATPVTCAQDILEALNIEKEIPNSVTESDTRNDLTDTERLVIRALIEPTHKDILIRTTRLSTAQANVLLMQMEMKGLIVGEGNVYRAVI